VATQPCPTYINQDQTRPPKATHSKPSRSRHDQSQVGAQRPITVMASTQARGAIQRRVLAWCVPRQVDPSAVPCDQSQSTTNPSAEQLNTVQQQQDIVKHTWWNVQPSHNQPTNKQPNKLRHKGRNNNTHTKQPKWWPHPTTRTKSIPTETN